MTTIGSIHRLRKTEVTAIDKLMKCLFLLNDQVKEANMKQVIVSLLALGYRELTSAKTSQFSGLC